MTLPLSKEQIEAIQACVGNAMSFEESAEAMAKHFPDLCQQALRAIELATKLAVTEFGFNTLERERDELQSDKDRLTKALEESRSIVQSVSLAAEYLDKHQRQLDRDGCEVGVSRQAADECVDALNRISTLVTRALPSPPSASQSEGEG